MSYRLDQGVEFCPLSLGDSQADRAIKTKLNYDIPFKIPITKGAQNINIRLQKCLYFTNNEDAITTSTIPKRIEISKSCADWFRKKMLGPSKDLISTQKIYESSNFSIYEDN